MDGLAGGTHRDDDFFRVLGAVIIEQVIFASGELGHLRHVFFDDRGDRFVILVGGFTVLEVDVRVLRGALLMRMIRVQGALSEFGDLVPIDQLGDFVIIVRVDLLDFVAGAEAVKEMKERHRALDRGQMRDQRHVLGFLNAGGGQHRKARLAAGHHVGVVAENGQGVRGQRARGNVEHAGQQLAGDFVHIGDHQQQALGRRKGRRQRARRQGAVHGAGSAAFGLHLGHVYLLAEQVLPALRRPLVDVLGHRRGGGDGVDRCYVAKGIGDVADGAVAVNGDLACHLGTSF